MSLIKTARDPLSMVFLATWDLLEAHKPFTDLVKPRNRIKLLGDNRDPDKEQISTEDLPEVRIIPAGGTPHLQHTSTGSSWLKRWNIQVSTGDMRVDHLLFPVAWETYRAMSKWAATMQALKWNDRTFVTLARPLQADEGISDRDLNRGIKGWHNVFAGETQMWFLTSDLQDSGV